MTTVTVATEIAAPVERVFQVFTDLEHSAARVSNIRKIELLTVGGPRLGARWLETREVLGRKDTAEMEITAYEQKRTYTITHHKAGARIDAVFTFTPRPTGLPCASSSTCRAAAFRPGRWRRCVGRLRTRSATSSAMTSQT